VWLALIYLIFQNFVNEANNSLQNRQSSVAREEGKKAELAKQEEEQQKWSKEVADLGKNISQVNATLSNKFQWITEDMNKHNVIKKCLRFNMERANYKLFQKLIEALQDLGQNLSAKVTTLEGVTNEMSEKQKPVAHSVASFNTQVSRTKLLLMSEFRINFCV
jgi:hypothetical protein